MAISSKLFSAMLIVALPLAGAIKQSSTANAPPQDIGHSKDWYDCGVVKYSKSSTRHLFASRPADQNLASKCCKFLTINATQDGAPGAPSDDDTIYEAQYSGPHKGKLDSPAETNCMGFYTWPNTTMNSVRNATYKSVDPLVVFMLDVPCVS